MPQNHYDEIGALLRQQREAMRLTREQAARMLHIRARYLHALEEGNLDDIPGLTYTRGYLQSYAGFLGLDKEEILRRFEQVEGLLVKKGFYFPEVFSREKKPARWALWGGLAFGFGLYLFWLVAVRPEQAALSLVQPPPKLAPPLSMPLNAACFQEQTALYPPCASAPVESLFPLPWQSQMDSIRELAQ